MTRDEADRAFHALFNAIDYAEKAVEQHPGAAVEFYPKVMEALDQMIDALSDIRIYRQNAGY